MAKKNYKSKTNDFIIDYYKKHGLNRTVKVAYKMLELNNHKDDKEFRAQVHGEIAESILEVGIYDFMQRHEAETEQWIIEKGMILKDPESGGKYLTELDMTIFTPYKIITIECKSFAGDKRFTDRCTVRRKGIRAKDVYDQHEKHYRTLMHNFSSFRILNEKSGRVSPLQIAYYDFSEGTVTDERDEKWRKMMPIINPFNLDKFLTQFINKPTYWRMDYVQRAVNIIGKNKKRNTSAHLKYVTSLDHSTDSKPSGFK